MINLRNSIKAIIVDEEKILFIKQKARDSGETFYILPGGGQEGGETFINTIKRECKEEIGAEIIVGEIVLIREYIGKNHEFAYKHANVHQIEYMFLCTLESAVDISKATHLDPEQTGYEWIDFSKLKEKNIYPKILKSVFEKQGKIKPPIYLGDVN